MKFSIARPVLAASLAGAAALSGCSAPQLYSAGQQWQQQSCRQLKDNAERSRCERSAATSFEQFQAEAQAARTPPR